MKFKIAFLLLMIVLLTSARIGMPTQVGMRELLLIVLVAILFDHALAKRRGV